MTCAILGFGFQAATKKAGVAKDPLTAGFEKVTVASVADAVDQITGQRGFLSHDMRPRTGNIRVVGRATTVLLKPAPADKATPALSTGFSTAMIDNSKPGEVGVIVIEDGLPSTMEWLGKPVSTLKVLTAEGIKFIPNLPGV